MTEENPRGGGRFERRVRPATVIGRWGDDTALLRLDDGSTVEVAVSEDLRDRFDVGDQINLEFEGDRVVGCEIPQVK
jgi:hypothetical protein